MKRGIFHAVTSCFTGQVQNYWEREQNRLRMQKKKAAGKHGLVYCETLFLNAGQSVLDGCCSLTQKCVQRN